MTAKVRMIAAIGKGRVLGKKNALLWNIPDDLKRFKELTQGHPCIMGRNTFDSIVGMIGKPLPKRTSIVLSYDPLPPYDGVVHATSIEDALAKAHAPMRYLSVVVHMYTPNSSRSPTNSTSPSSTMKKKATSTSPRTKTSSPR
jgi:dihydrofolate reductase